MQSINWRLWPLRPTSGWTLVNGLPPSWARRSALSSTLPDGRDERNLPRFIREINGNCRKSTTSSLYPVCCLSATNNPTINFINHQPSVFLGMGGQSSAAVLRQTQHAEETYYRKWHYTPDCRCILMLSGDIESNPGPYSKNPQKCDTCHTTVSKSAFHKCQACNAVSHKKKECSGINRGLDRPWWCKEHRETDVPTNDDTKSCSVCEKTIRCTSIPLKCPDCEALCHRYFTCSGIPTYNKDLIWKCKDHSDRENNRSKCYKCNNNFSKSYVPLKCQQCDLHGHKQHKCSGIPKGTRYPVWNCGNHGEEEPAPDPTLEFPLCVTCNIAVSATNPLKCQDCERVCHRVPKCSGIKRNPRKINNGLDGFWNCGNHMYNPGSKCTKCNLSFDEEAETLKCEECEERCHRNFFCSGIKSRAKNKNWNCGGHIPQDSTPVAPEPTSPPPRETEKCRKEHQSGNRKMSTGKNSKKK